MISQKSEFENYTNYNMNVNGRLGDQKEEVRKGY
jgi:hypothetical protein